MKLNLGCGNDFLQGYINIDKRDDADLTLDLEMAHLPYDNESVEEVQALQVLEHVQNLIPLLNEIHRVLEKGGSLHVSVPNAAFLEAFQDPTHIRFFTRTTFDYWNINDGYWQSVGKGYGIRPFSMVTVQESSWMLLATLIK